MDRCKVCKHKKVLTTAVHYLGLKRVWECKCGRRLYRYGDLDWCQLSKAQREAMGIETEDDDS